MNLLLILLLAEATAVAAEPVAEELATAPASPRRPRWRAGVEAGPALMYSRYSYLIFGGSIVGRIGLQPHPMVAIAYQGGLGYFAGSADFGDISESPAYLVVQNAPMVLLTPVDFFELGLGPAFDGVIGRKDFDSGVAIGIDGRVGFHIPVGPQDERRFGVSIALDYRPVNLFREINPDKWLQHFQLSAGVDWY
jgi:hypothetical protein